MTELGAVGIHWFRIGSWLGPKEVRTRHGGPPLRVACPHCTNVDTLSRHCPNVRCGWVRCTCGALIYNRRRHRHPRHGSGQDTCHDPVAAV